jgi:small subunit ribosomal protein S21
MIIVNLNGEKNIDSALKLYKSKVQKTRQINQLKDRKEFVKPSVKKREVKLNAIYSQKLKNGLN